MKLLKIRTKIKQQAKTIIFSSLILSILLIIAGILLLIFKEHIINYIEYFLLVFFIQAILLNLFLFWKYKRKIFIALVPINIIILIIFLILYYCTSLNILNIVAYFMAISSILNAVEGVVELIDNKKDKIRSIVIIIKILIELFFAISLFLNKGDSVYTHLIIFGILFIIEGILSTLSIIISNQNKID